MYENLQELGITETDSIEKYTLRQEGDEDILKIYFRRKRGDFFAHCTKFRFGRSKKAVRVNSGSNGCREVSEVSPIIGRLTAELDQIVNREESIADFKRRILSDIEHLEKVIQRKLEQLKEDVSALD